MFQWDLIMVIYQVNSHRGGTPTEMIALFFSRFPIPHLFLRFQGGYWGFHGDFWVVELDLLVVFFGDFTGTR